jgi:hypothetical protein
MHGRVYTAELSCMNEHWHLLSSNLTSSMAHIQEKEKETSPMAHHQVREKHHLSHAHRTEKERKVHLACNLSYKKCLIFFIVNYKTF